MAKNTLTVSKATKQRVEQRIRAAHSPAFTPHRRDFSKRKTLGLSMVKALVWTLV